ncbi:MAG: pyroglutamyl-peptidase I family protein [Candidatus Kariarchaeaceae archaeon]|jgi:pyroglutamyl-peptidase
MSVILLTGFEAFANWEVNPTAIAAQKINGMKIGNHKLIGKTLPLRYHEIRGKLKDLYLEYHPDMMILTGQGSGGKIRLERVAKNNVESKVPYNCGATPSGEYLIEDGKEELNSTLPLNDMFIELEKLEIPVTYSDSAGLFGCNQVFYYGQHDYQDIPSGFIHVPLLPEQAKPNEPCMDQDTITRALKICVEVAAKSI